MEHLLIGLTVGIIMGLTGAGGALISIPLFISLLNSSIKEATVLSLVAVIIGTSVNLFGQASKASLKIVLLLVSFGAVTNYLSLPLKAMLPDLAIAGLLLLIGSYSVWSVWQKPGEKHQSTESVFKTAIFGSGLGILTTLTGLGGGVLLVPILIRFYNKNYEEALPSSLMTILLISLISLSLQFKTAMQIIDVPELGLLVTGSLVAFFLLKAILKKFNKDTIQLLRKVTFTAVALYSVTAVLIKSI